MINIIFLIHAVFAADKTETLIELYRSQPKISESYSLTVQGNKEFITQNSNRFSKKKYEFGTYSRNKTSITKQLKGIIASQPKLKTETKKPKNWSPHDWQIKVLGQSIDKNNPRYGELFKLLNVELTKKNWKPEKIHSIKLGAFEVKETIMASNKITVTKHSFFKACKTSLENRPACSFKQGFVFID